MITGLGATSANRCGCKVQAAIRELNYHPNHVARSLKTSKTRTLGIIVPDMTISLLPADHSRRGNRRPPARLFPHRGQLRRRWRAPEGICSRSCDRSAWRAFCWSSPRRRRRSAQITRILDADIPVVCLDRIPDRVPVDSVSVEDVAAARDGRRAPDRDGLPANRDRHRRHRAEERTAARCRATGRRWQPPGLRVDEDLIWHGNLRPDEVNALCRERLRDAATRPDAVFCTNGPTALGVLRAFRDCRPGDAARYRLR